MTSSPEPPVRRASSFTRYYTVLPGHRPAPAGSPTCCLQCADSRMAASRPAPACQRPFAKPGNSFYLYHFEMSSVVSPCLLIFPPFPAARPTSHFPSLASLLTWADAKHTCRANRGQDSIQLRRSSGSSTGNWFLTKPLASSPRRFIVGYISGKRGEGGWGATSPYNSSLHPFPCSSFVKLRLMGRKRHSDL